MVEIFLYSFCRYYSFTCTFVFFIFSTDLQKGEGSLFDRFCSCMLRDYFDLCQDDGLFFFWNVDTSVVAPYKFEENVVPLNVTFILKTFVLTFLICVYLSIKKALICHCGDYIYYLFILNSL